MTGRSSCRSKAGPPCRRDSGSATQSCRASRGTASSPTEYSEWAMPAPLVMRLRAPRRTITSLPTVSRWRTSPTNGQVTVCSPMCGMRLDAHARHLRSEPVEEAPGTDQRQVALGQAASHLHRPDAAERHLARLEQQGLGAVAFGGLLGGDRVIGVEPGHRGTVTPGSGARATRCRARAHRSPAGTQTPRGSAG